MTKLHSLDNFISHDRKHHFENRVLFKPLLGGVASAVHFSTGPGQTKYRVYYHLFGVVLAFKGSNYSELINDPVRLESS